MNFDEFSAQLKSLGNKVSGIEISEQHFSAWKNSFKSLTPQQVHNSMQRAVGEGNDIILRFRVNKEGLVGRASIMIVSRDTSLEDKDRLSSISVPIYHQDREARIEGFYIAQAQQDQGLAKRVLLSYVDIFQDMGIESVALDADEIGSYAWAKIGFTPSSEVSWDNFREKIKGRLSEDNTTLRHGSQEYDVSSEAPLLKEALGSDFQTANTAIQALTELNREIDSTGERPVTVGKALLFNVPYSAKLNLNESSPDFQRFQAYTGQESRAMGVA